MSDRSDVELLVGYVKIKNQDWQSGVDRDRQERIVQAQEMVAMLERALEGAREVLAALQQPARPAPRQLAPDHQPRIAVNQMPPRPREQGRGE